MKAILMRAGKAVFDEVPVPRPDPGEVLIRVAYSTICRTDLYASNGRILTPEYRILGHEFSGVIEEVGGEAGFEAGQEVVVNPALPCGECRQCLSGQIHRCGNLRFLGLDLDGSFAEFIRVPAASVHTLPPGLPLELATYAEPVAAAQAVLDVGIGKDETVLVFGDGRIADLTRDVLLDAGHGNVSTGARGTDLGGEWDVIVETDIAGRDMGMLLQHLVTGGTLVLKSRTPSWVEIPLWDCVKKQITIKAAHYGPFEAAIDYLAVNQETIRPYLGEFFHLAHFEEAFRTAEASEAKKITLIPGA